MHSLNPIQQEAVQHFKGPLLILAGAGSGKTRVLTHRIAYLIDEYDVNPYNILALTFTNKAANEMRERVDQLIGFGSENIWVSTFHSTCVRMLRRHIDHIGYDRSFTIYDSDDQKTLIRDIVKYLNIDTKRYKERSFMTAISSAKDELIGPKEYELEAGKDFGKKVFSDVYTEYQKRLKANNALDFDDLIMKTVELLQKDEEVANYYRNRFKYILVDEYQDTNTAQFMLLSLLAKSTNEQGEIEHNLCVVGDDDQSIYKFRGANIYNILNFEKVYPEAKVIRLEQNYRSTKTILDAANEVIKHNQMRKEKALWTEQEEGEPITFAKFANEYEEATGVVNDIDTKINESGSTLNYNDFAILYRTNAQSRVLEEKLIMKGIPYRIVGGVNFYSRKEIKDLMCYLKCVANSADDLSAKRIINVPKRGIGLTTIDRVNAYAIDHDISFYEALKQADYIDGCGRAASKINSFVSFIEILKDHEKDPDNSLTGLLDEIIEATGYVEALQAEETDEANSRIENIEELKSKVAHFEEEAEQPATLTDLLEEIALVADIDNVEDDTNQVLLLTLHSAKGLEFPNVYICGLEDGIFPGSMAIFGGDESEIEEERRLCYVGITRAKKHLTLTCASQRMRNGEININPESRFLHEIPRHLLTYTGTERETKRKSDLKPFTPPKSKTHVYNAGSSNPFARNPYIQKGFNPVSSSDVSYAEGDRVRHNKFGEGTVLSLAKSGNDYEVVIEFEDFGQRKLRTSFAKLEKI